MSTAADARGYVRARHGSYSEDDSFGPSGSRHRRLGPSRRSRSRSVSRSRSRSGSISRSPSHSPTRDFSDLRHRTSYGSQRNRNRDRNRDRERDRERERERERDRERDRDRDRPNHRDRRIIKDPLTLDHVLEWSSFAIYLREQGLIGKRPNSRAESDRQHVEITAKYNEYTALWRTTQIRRFFEAHEKEDWMLDRYHPDACTMRAEAVRNFKSGALLQRFRLLLDLGHFNSVSCEIVPGHENECAAWETEFRNDLARRTLIIRNVPLDVARADIESVFASVPGFWYLSLSDPRVISPAAALHAAMRPGHSLVIHSSSGGGGSGSAAIGVGVGGGGGGGGNGGSNSSTNTRFALGTRVGWVLFESPEQADVAIQRFMESKATAQSGIYSRITTSITSPDAIKVRTTLSAAFSRPERILVDLQQATRVAMNLDAELGISGYVALMEHLRSSMDTDTVEASPTSLIAQQQQAGAATIASSGTAAEPDANSSIEMVAHPVYGAPSVEVKTEVQTKNVQQIVTKERHELDAIVEYLRRVHLYCYYSGGVMCESPEALVWKCGNKMLRRSISAAAAGGAELSEADMKHLADFDAMIARRFDSPPTTDEELKPLGARSLDAAVDEQLHSSIVKENENRFCCDVADCKKRFMGIEFALKHIRNKHEEFVASVAQQLYPQITYVNNFLLDPHRLLPAILDEKHSAPLTVNPLTGAGYFGDPDRLARTTARLPQMPPRPVLREREQRFSHRESNVTWRREHSESRPIRSYVDLDAPVVGDVVLDYD